MVGGLRLAGFGHKAAPQLGFAKGHMHHATHTWPKAASIIFNRPRDKTQRHVCIMKLIGLLAIMLDIPTMLCTNLGVLELVGGFVQNLCIFFKTPFEFRGAGGLCDSSKVVNY